MSIRAYDNPRERDQWIQFERNEPITQPSGDTKPRWQRICGCFARVDGAKASGPEPVIADGTRSVRDYVFWVQADLIGRYCITVVDRVLWRGRVFDIADIPDQQLRGRLLTVIARAGANAG